MLQKNMTPKKAISLKKEFKMQRIFECHRKNIIFLIDEYQKDVSNITIWTYLGNNNLKAAF